VCQEAGRGREAQGGGVARRAICPSILADKERASQAQNTTMPVSQRQLYVNCWLGRLVLRALALAVTIVCVRPIE